MAIKISSIKKKQYEIDGYFILESIIPADHLELLQSECQHAVDQVHAKMDRQGTDILGINHRGNRYFCGQPSCAHPSLKAFIFSDLMAEICRATIGNHAYFHNDQYVVKKGQPGMKSGMKFSWHQDSAYVQAKVGKHPEHITCWCALDDMTDKNGTTYILPISRYGNRKLADHVTEKKSNDRVGYFGNDPGDPVIVPSGSIAVFSSLTFHRSGPNVTGRERRAYLTQYSPAPIVNAPGAHPQYYAEPFLVDGTSVVA